MTHCGITPSLQELSFDILHNIGPFLDARDYTSLGLTSKTLARHFQDNGTARKLLKAHYGHSSAGKHALGSGSAIRQQLARFHSRREALRTARPYSITHIANATNFAYADGLLVYTTADSIRLLDLSRPDGMERVISNRFLTSKLPFTGSRASSILPNSTNIIAYKDNIVALLASFGPTIGDYLIALDVQSGNIRQRCLLSERLHSTNKLFCIIGESYLYYGTHSASSSQGYPEWLVHGFNLDASILTTTTTPADPYRRCPPISTNPIQLSRLSGLDLSSTITFTIHRNHFIALTNQTGHEAEEVNWTSYHRYIAFPLDAAIPDLAIKRVFRRQDHEGPINDTWTELKFTTDESTGDLILVEGRKEWLAGHDGWERTWYSVPWESASTQHAEWDDVVSTNPADPLNRTVRSDGEGRDECGEEVLTRWEDISVKRAERWCHREYPPVKDDGGRDGEEGGMAKEYIRAKTKFSSYDFNRGCAVELVVDDVPDGDSWRTKERLSVRVVSRLEMSPLGAVAGAVAGSASAGASAGAESSRIVPGMITPRDRNQDGVEIEGSELRFAPSEIHTWPDFGVQGQRQRPDRGGEEVWDEIAELMCPNGRAGEVKGVLGEEGVVYSVGAAGRGGERRLVFVCFDPVWGFEGMRGLHGEEVMPRHKDRNSEVRDRGRGEEREEGASKGKRKAGLEDEHETTESDSVLGQGVKRQRSESPHAVAAFAVPVPAAVTADVTAAVTVTATATAGHGSGSGSRPGDERHATSSKSPIQSHGNGHGHGHARHDSGIAGLNPSSSPSFSSSSEGVEEDIDLILGEDGLRVVTAPPPRGEDDFPSHLSSEPGDPPTPPDRQGSGTLPVALSTGGMGDGARTGGAVVGGAGGAGGAAGDETGTGTRTRTRTDVDAGTGTEAMLTWEEATYLRLRRGFWVR